MILATYGGALRRPRSLACYSHATLLASLYRLPYVARMGVAGKEFT
jgi:hypothetical protein